MVYLIVINEVWEDDNKVTRIGMAFTTKEAAWKKARKISWEMYCEDNSWNGIETSNGVHLTNKNGLIKKTDILIYEIKVES